MDAVERAELRNPALQTRFSVITKVGVNDFRKTVRFVFNYSGQPSTYIHQGGAATELLTKRAVADGGTLKLAPWDLTVIEENSKS